MTAQSIETLIKEQVAAAIAELSKDGKSFRMTATTPMTRAEKRAARTAKAKERLLRIHKLAQWAVEHGAEDELFGKK